MQHYWPGTSFTWIIGKNEYALVSEIDGVEFITFDKALGFGAYRDIHSKLASRHFDILLHMQLSLRASITSLLIKAGIKLGFDRARSKDMQWLFTNQKINPQSTRQHVVDSFLEFPRHFGLKPLLNWELPVSATAMDNVRHMIGGDKFLAINPFAVAKSRNWRNWTAEGYAEVADYAAEHHGMTVLLTGGPSADERSMAETIVAMCGHKPLNMVGKTTLPELAALLQLSEVVIAPDTGPAHIASALGTPVIGL